MPFNAALTESVCVGECACVCVYVCVCVCVCVCLYICELVCKFSDMVTSVRLVHFSEIFTEIIAR